MGTGEAEREECEGHGGGWLAGGVRVDCRTTAAATAAITTRSTQLFRAISFWFHVVDVDSIRQESLIVLK